MADDSTDGAAGDATSDTAPDPPTSSAASGGVQAVMNHMSQDKVEAAMWASRIATILFAISYVIPVFGLPQHTSGQRVLISGAITSALRLHQRMPQMRLSREFIGQLFMEDSAHYLFYSALMLFTTQAVSITLMPVFLFALLHVTKYTKTLVNLLGPTSLQLVRRLITQIETRQREILKLIATVEITLMPTSLLLIITGTAALMLPFIYYRFLCLRYSSIRNPYNKTVFNEMRLLAEYLTRDRRCPAFVGTVVNKCIAFICRMAPAQPVPQAQ